MTQIFPETIIRELKIDLTKEISPQLCDNLSLNLRVEVFEGPTRVGYFNQLQANSSDDGIITAMRSVLTEKSFRGKGFGRKLVEIAECIGKKLGYQFLYVSVNDGKGSEGAQGFYEHVGFVVCNSYTTNLTQIFPQDSQNSIVFLKKKL